MGATKSFFLNPFKQVPSVTSGVQSPSSSSFSGLSSSFFRSFRRSTGLQESPEWLCVAVLGVAVTTTAAVSTVGGCLLSRWRCGGRSSEKRQEDSRPPNGDANGNESETKRGILKSIKKEKKQWWQRWWTKPKETEKAEEKDTFTFLDPIDFAFTKALHKAKQKHFFVFQNIMNEIRQLVSTLNATTIPIPPLVVAGGVEELGDTERMSASVPIPSSTCDEERDSTPLHADDIEERQSGGGKDDSGGTGPLPWSPPVSSLSNSRHGFPSMPSEMSTCTGGSLSSTAHRASLWSPTSSGREDSKHHHRQLQDRLRERCLEANELLTRYMIALDQLPVEGRVGLKQKRKELLLEATEYEAEIEKYQNSMLFGLSEVKRMDKES